MLDKETRTAILALHNKGHSQRAIADDLKISRISVKRVLSSGLTTPAAAERTSQLDAYTDDIRSFYAECKGNVIRVQEKLRDIGCEVSYSTLTWFCREHGIGVEEKSPAQRIVTGPGEEMQHDTSPYTIVIGGKKVHRHAASLVLGYSRMIYVQFYATFDRFHCKTFLTRAFQYFGGTCGRCMIDNTHVVVLCGSGADAQMTPEMESFEERFGFRFEAHALGHADRSGKVERPFWYIERNFLVGRTFKDDADLNAQALAWVEKANRRRLREFKAAPLELFVVEKPRLISLPLHIPEVYRLHRRTVDSYSCVSVLSFKYPVPAAYLGREVLIRETFAMITVLDGHKEIAVHDKKQEGDPLAPLTPTESAPRRQKQSPLAEEGKLAALGADMKTYLESLKKERGPRYIWSVRKLFQLMCQYKSDDLITAVQKAAQHRLFDVRRVETILLQNLAERDYHLPLGFSEAVQRDQDDNPGE
jgi:transposase